MTEAPAELTELIWLRFGIWPNCTSSGAVTEDVITSGLAPGDRIVVDGADKLRDGAKINIRTEAGVGTPPPGPVKSGGKKQRSDNGQKQ